MIENKDMYISAPDIFTSQSKMYVKSNKASTLNTGEFDWNDMTSTASIKIDDGTGIFYKLQI